jgi:hypothetical protein
MSKGDFDYWQQHGEERIKGLIEDIKPVFWSSTKNEVVSNCAGETIRKLVTHLRYFHVTLGGAGWWIHPNAW